MSHVNKLKWVWFGFFFLKDHALHPPLPARPVVNQGLEPIDYFQYDPTIKDWIVSDQDSSFHESPTTSAALRVVSYNVLSSPALNVWTCEVARWNFILDSLLPLVNADVFMLNEVSETFWKMAMERDWIRNGYYVTDYHFNNGPRNNMIISRFPLQSLQRETVNERRSYIAKIEAKAGVPLWIICSHLHAQYPGYLIRRAQLDAMYEYIKNTCGTDPVLIMGDLNFHDERENENILPPFFDVYRSLNPLSEDPTVPWNEAQLGITFDVPNNAMVNIMGWAFSARMRLDRALMRPSTSTTHNDVAPVETYIPNAMSIFAKDAISPLTPDLLPSDHYALQLDFTIATPKISK
jgi:poly(A) polymerase